MNFEYGFIQKLNDNVQKLVFQISISFVKCGKLKKFWLRDYTKANPKKIMLHNMS